MNNYAEITSAYVLIQAEVYTRNAGGHDIRFRWSISVFLIRVSLIFLFSYHGGKDSLGSIIIRMRRSRFLFVSYGKSLIASELTAGPGE